MENKYKVKIARNSREAFLYMEKNIPYIVCLTEENKHESFPNGAYCVESLDDIDEKYMENVYRRFKGIPWDIAETERLRIREIQISDVPRLYELYADESITRYMEPLFPKVEQEVEYTRDYIRNVYGFYGYGMWVIVEKRSGVIVGRVGLEHKEGFDGLELGFMLGKDYQHKGYAYEACRAVLSYGKEELSQANYCAFVDENNEASIRLCRRLGFTLLEKDKNTGLLKFVFLVNNVIM
jgi:RimJ/RimL family protein N-acetyltransferase